MPTNVSGTNGIDQIQAGAVQSDDVSAGMVIQVANYTTGAMATGTTIIPADDTIPQNTEGTQFMSLAFTPKKANSLLKIEVIGTITAAVGSQLVGALFRDSGANAIGISSIQVTAGWITTLPTITIFVTAGSIAATTFTFRAGGNSATTYTFNGIAGARQYGGVLASSITITEIAQ